MQWNSQILEKERDKLQAKNIKITSILYPLPEKPRTIYSKSTIQRLQQGARLRPITVILQNLQTMDTAIYR